MYETHVLHQDYDKYSRRPRANRSKKWTHILIPIWKEFTEHGIVQDEDDEDGDSDGYDTATEEEEKEGNGIKMYLQKKGRSFALNKTTDGAIKFCLRPKLAGVHGKGLYLHRGGDLYCGGFLLGKNSPFRNISVLGWLL